jgi:hypothetical protein
MDPAQNLSTMKVYLPFREPRLGKDYWIEDNVLPNPMEVAEKCITKNAWTLGSPWRSVAWPGMRAQNALTKEELSLVEKRVKKSLGIKEILPQSNPETGTSSHNNIQIVGKEDGVARPHLDSAKICDFAVVTTPSPKPSNPALR